MEYTENTEGFCVSVIEFPYLYFFPCIQCGPWLNTPVGQAPDAYLAFYKVANWQSLWSLTILREDGLKH